MRRRAFLRSIAAIGMCSPLLAAAGCATGSAASSKGTAPHTSTCALVAHLDDIASGIGRADVSDPTKFTHQLDDAVGEYVTTLRQLSAQAPARLRPGLDRVSADVQQYRFADARTDRADLDDYAATACGRHPADTDTSTTAPTAPTTTTTSVSTPGG